MKTRISSAPPQGGSCPVQGGCRGGDGTGTDIAMEAGDATLMRSDLLGVVSLVTLARKTMRIIRQNLFWAFVYNFVGIPLAAGLLYPAFGLLLSPIIASEAMALSSVRVVSNSLRLRGIRLGKV